MIPGWLRWKYSYASLPAVAAVTTQGSAINFPRLGLSDHPNTADAYDTYDIYAPTPHNICVRMHAAYKPILYSF